MQNNLLKTKEQKELYKLWLFGKITDQEFEVRFDKTLNNN